MHLDAQRRLREHGLRVTAPRLAILGALEETPHGDIEEIAAGARERIGSVSAQGVYDVLAAFCRVGLARRIEPAGSPARFEARVGDNHHHAVCRDCGAIADVDCEIGDPPCLTPLETQGYEVDEAEVTFWGLCPTCQDGKRQPAVANAREALRAAGGPPVTITDHGAPGPSGA